MKKSGRQGSPAGILLSPSIPDRLKEKRKREPWQPLIADPYDRSVPPVSAGDGVWLGKKAGEALPGNLLPGYWGD